MRLAFIDGRAYYPPALPFPRLMGHGRASGMGASNSPSASQEFGVAIQGAQAGAATALMLGGSTKANIVGGIQAGILTAAPFTGPAAPIVAAIGALIGPIASLFKGCGQSCTQATQYADAAAEAFEQVSQLYWAQPVRTRAMQQAALDGISGVMEQMRQACSNPQLGAAGQRCISERLTRTGTPPGCKSNYVAPVPGGFPGIKQGAPCNAYTYYIDPISNDPGVVADPSPSLVTTDADGNAVINVGGQSLSLPLPMPLLLVGAGLLALMVFSGGGGGGGSKN